MTDEKLSSLWRVGYALLEGRVAVGSAGDAVSLTDPPPESLATVAAQWELVLEPT